MKQEKCDRTYKIDDCDIASLRIRIQLVHICTGALLTPPQNSQRIPEPRMPMPQPPLLHAQSPIPFPPLPPPILPPQIPHLRHRQCKTTHHRAQTNPMPQPIIRRIPLQIHKRANKRTTIRYRNNNPHPRGPHIVRREIIARPADDHRTTLKHADGDEKRARVAGCVVGRDEEQDVPDEADDCACGDEGAARFEAVGEVGAGEDGDEGGDVGGYGEELRGGGVVAHALDDGGEEEGEAVEGDLQDGLAGEVL
jgi:hypothetical protein